MFSVLGASPHPIRHQKISQEPKVVNMPRTIKNRIFSIDRGRINTFLELKELNQHIPLDRLNKICKTIIKPPSKIARWYGYRSTIEFFGLPADKSKLFFQNLLFLENCLHYSISYIELAKDVFFIDRDKLFKAHHLVLNHQKKKYTSKGKIFFNGTLYSGNRLDKKKEKFFSRSYDRDSKITGEECLHCEWQIEYPSNIKKKLGVNRIQDLIDLDISKCIDELNKKYLGYYEIDREKFARKRYGIHGNAKLSDKHLSKIKSRSAVYRKINNIVAIVDLDNHIADLKNEKSLNARKQNLVKAGFYRVTKELSVPWL